MKNKKNFLPYAIFLLSLLIIWTFAAKVVSSSLVLPMPHIVLKEILNQISSYKFWISFLYTFLRIVLAFALSFVSGFVIAYISSLSNFAKKVLEPYISILQITPVVALIFAVNFWFSSNFVPVFVGILMALPVVTKSVYAGLVSTDEKLLQVAKVYNFSMWKTFWKIKLPAAKNYIISVVETVFGLCWKVVVAGEVLCLPKKAVGTILQKGNVHMETSVVMAVTIILITVCFFIQKILALVLSCKEHKNKL